MGFFDSIGSFFSDNASWLKPVASTALNIGSQLNQSGARNAYVDMLKENEDRNYQQGLGNYNAYTDWLRGREANSAANSAAGAASARARAASAAAAQAAYAAAAKQQEKNRVKALKKAKNREEQGFNEALNLYKPYVEAGAQVLPGMTKAYGSSLDTAGLLNSLLTSPDSLQKLNQGTAAYNVNIPLPDYLKGKA